MSVLDEISEIAKRCRSGAAWGDSTGILNEDLARLMALARAGATQPIDQYALARSPMVWVVVCIEPGDERRETKHIFSTAAKAQAFCDGDKGRAHVVYDYAIDCPERHEESVS